MELAVWYHKESHIVFVVRIRRRRQHATTVMGSLEVASAGGVFSLIQIIQNYADT